MKHFLISEDMLLSFAKSNHMDGCLDQLTETLNGTQTINLRRQQSSKSQVESLLPHLTELTEEQLNKIQE